MTVYNSVPPDNFIEISVPQERGFSSWDCHVHFKSLDEIEPYFQRCSNDFFESGYMNIERCTNEAEEQIIRDLFEQYCSRAEERQRLEQDIQESNSQLVISQKWLEFYNDILAGAPHTKEMLKQHKHALAEHADKVAKTQERLKNL